MPTEAVALDASAVAKLVLQEPESATFVEWYRQLPAVGIRPESSTLLQFELGNILQREFPRDSRNGDILRSALHGIATVSVAPASPFQFAPPLTYYDSSYLCVARASGALATYDGRLERLSVKQGIEVWSHSRMQAALRPGFVAWLRRKRTSVPALTLRDEWSYFQALAWADGLTTAKQGLVALLDQGFAGFARA